MSRQVSATAAFLKQVFRRYYSEHGDEVAGMIGSVKDREFGFSHFDREGVTRHLCFSNSDELIKYLVKEGPRDVYASVAYYALPCEASSMEAKGWLGADLVFDIDADHVIGKGASITYGVCVNCARAFENVGTCPSCGMALNEVSLVTEIGLTAAAEETAKLIEVLRDDFGFDEREMSIFFSGHRGFHVQIFSDRIKSLTPRERIEIVDYLTLRGFSTRWGRDRIMREVERGRIGLPEDVNDAVEKLSLKIDPVVTIDVHRLLRAPMSLHGKTGLSKIPVSDPLTFETMDATSLLPRDEVVSVKVIKIPRLEFGGESYGPYSNERVKLPLNVATLLLCLGAAVVVE